VQIVEVEPRPGQWGVARDRNFLRGLPRKTGELGTGEELLKERKVLKEEN
jgi:hypothetical protein